MIISASRRTDIPSYYSDWFFNRLNAGYVYVRNPMSIHKISNIPLTKDVVDGFVFWTKNPAPMLNKIHFLKDYTYYFQFTVNSYGNDIEPNIPSKNDVIIPTFQRLSSEIGKERVIWRYDPIFLNEKYTMEYHKRYFEKMCDKLSNYTQKCTISFLDLYRNMQRNIAKQGIITLNSSQIIEIAESFSVIAKEHNIYIDTCAEKIDLEKYGIKHAHCIDQERLECIGGYKLNANKDKNQRVECGCIESIDIGAYNTCKNSCIYCYANYSQKIVSRNFNFHDPNSPLLFGQVTENDKIVKRKCSSIINKQIKLFD